MASTRTTAPSYDLITGAPSNTQPPSLPTSTSRLPLPPSSRRLSLSQNAPPSKLRQSLTGLPTNVPARSTIDNETLRAQLNTLQYEIDTLRQDRAVQVEGLQAEIREAERRVEGEARRAVEAEKGRAQAERRLEEGRRDALERGTRGENERAELERRLRERVEEIRGLREEVEEGRSEVEMMRREGMRGVRELEGRCEALEKQRARGEEEREVLEGVVRGLKEEVVGRDRKVGELEQEVLRLRAATGDQETLGVVKRELGEQVGHIKRLEKMNAETNAEVKRLRRERKAVEVVEEEKRVLEGKLGLLDDVRRELGESEIKRRMLEDERRAWAAYLENQEGEGTFDSPEEMARAFVQERIEKLQLVEQLGQVQPELTVKDEAINSLEQEKITLQAELKRLKSMGGGGGGPGPDSKALARLERQRTLAVKEVEYLRAQLKSLEDETTEFDPEKADQSTASKTVELEALVDQYKREMADLHSQLTKLEAQPPAPVPASLKRPAPDSDENEAMGTLQRKLRKLQSTVVSLDSKNATLKNDLKASNAQLVALRESSRTRVLELTNNPTAQFEAVKVATLKTLRSENDALLAQIEGRSPPPATVPAAVVEALKVQLEEKDAELAQRDKKTLRLQQIWKGKVREYQEAVAATLGWTVKFMPNGQLQLSSIYYPSGINSETGEEEENTILFDSQKSTMKVSGGTQSRFAEEIRDMVEFWIEGRREVPCFLAAASLEFWERDQQAKEKDGN
ncbi:putative mitotic checkpoint protein [Elsinoe fawcettii]|nr:putative mitotic checkpoint protein [Elsinoe fawcettii]